MSAHARRKPDEAAKRKRGRKPAVPFNPLVPIDLESLGPNMRALASDRQRAAVIARFLVRTNTEAVALVGYGKQGTSKRRDLWRIAFDVFHNPKVQLALHEVGEQYLRAGVPDAIACVQQIMADVKHKDRLRAAQIFIDRAHPLQTHHHVTVEHIDHDAEAVAQLRMLKSLGVARAKLEEVFGVNGVTRFERLLALEDGKRADKAKVIDGEVTS